MGFAFPVWDFGSPERAETAPSGARLAHFEGFFHEEPPERRLKVGVETIISQ
jgi:hypothetical protein